MKREIIRLGTGRRTGLRTLGDSGFWIKTTRVAQRTVPAHFASPVTRTRRKVTVLLALLRASTGRIARRRCQGIRVLTKSTIRSASVHGTPTLGVAVRTRGPTESTGNQTCTA